MMEKANRTLEAHFYLNGESIALDEAHFVGFRGGAVMYQPEAVEGQPGVYRVTGMPEGPIELMVGGKAGDRNMVAFPEPFEIREGETFRLMTNLLDVINFRIQLSAPEGVAVPTSPMAYNVSLPAFPEFSRVPKPLMLQGDHLFFYVPKGGHAMRIRVEGFEPVELIPEELGQPAGAPNSMTFTLALKPLG